MTNSVYENLLAIIQASNLCTIVTNKYKLIGWSIKNYKNSKKKVYCAIFEINTGSKNYNLYRDIPKINGLIANFMIHDINIVLNLLLNCVFVKCKN